MSDPLQEAASALAPSGRLRAAINFGNAVLAQRDPATGEARGITVDLAREIAKRLGVPLDLVLFDAAGKVFEALGRGEWDMAFMAIDPVRGAQMDFTAPYVFIEGTYLVRSESRLRDVAAVDAPGVRIAASRGSAYELHLRRELRHAELVHADSPQAAFDLFMQGGLDALAAVRQPLARFAQARPGLRVLDGAFMRIDQALGVPKGRDRALRWLDAFIAQAKADGFVAAALQRSGQGDATIAA